MLSVIFIGKIEITLDNEYRKETIVRNLERLTVDDTEEIVLQEAKRKSWYWIKCISHVIIIK